MKNAEEMTVLGFNTPIPDAFAWPELSGKSDDEARTTAIDHFEAELDHPLQPPP